ncbi:short-chain dehydrogenase [Wenjunlia vitaminophila]|uniref:Short-chain dehydrogenase n=1 Tax=Wenjunlia vitaminophila TaxID=76728 RepID=A0A0T6LWY8_WENVI|nr:SDR family oxidoreductase [Wenjunlia vitaminophila]KRV50513.1 short-chain dehydrogenase [Wenjunlia vitaminophila]
MPTAFITGATAGIGAAFTRRLAADGFDLVLLARDRSRLEEAAERYRTTHRVRVETLIADLATDEGLAAAEDRARHGVDLLVNNAGFAQRGTFLRTDVGEEVAMLRVHCEAVLRLSHAALPGMMERGRGGVINVASVAAFFTRGTYSASKAWVVNFSESVLRDIAGSGAHVMALCPGWTHTEFHDRASMDMSGVPGFLWLDADELVDAAVRDFRRGVPVSVPGLPYKAFIALGRALPHGLTTRISTRVGRRYR